MIVKILKALHLYTPIKRLKDNIQDRIRDNGEFDKEMSSMYGQFIKEGDLCFDLGAYNGNRTEQFLKLGAKQVITVEPTKYSYDKLKKKFAKESKIILLKVEIADKEGKQTMSLCSSSAFSTFEDSWVKEINTNPKLANLEWTGKEEIDMVSINNLIEQYGLPHFLKIDIEGYEEKAFSTLKYAIPMLSFEYLIKFPERTTNCIYYLCALGDYEFNYSVGESMKLALPEWCNGVKILEELQKADQNVIFGDVYCRLKQKNDTR
jgi:FkbM family methyltransferase